MTAKRIPLGPTGTALMKNIAAARHAHRLTYAALSERLAEIDRPIPTLGLSRIERGDRRVDADDLVALSIALDVDVTALLGLEGQQSGVVIERPEMVLRVRVSVEAAT